jgi:hypothetical protein
VTLLPGANPPDQVRFTGVITLEGPAAVIAGKLDTTTVSFEHLVFNGGKLLELDCGTDSTCKGYTIKDVTFEQGTVLPVSTTITGSVTIQGTRSRGFPVITFKNAPSAPTAVVTEYVIDTVESGSSILIRQHNEGTSIYGEFNLSTDTWSNVICSANFAAATCTQWAAAFTDGTQTISGKDGESTSHLEFRCGSGDPRIVIAEGQNWNSVPTYPKCVQVREVITGGNPLSSHWSGNDSDGQDEGSSDLGTGIGIGVGVTAVVAVIVVLLVLFKNKLPCCGGGSDGTASN